MKLKSMKKKGQIQTCSDRGGEFSFFLSFASLIWLSSSICPSLSLSVCQRFSTSLSLPLSPNWGLNRKNIGVKGEGKWRRIKGAETGAFITELIKMINVLRKVKTQDHKCNPSVSFSFLGESISHELKSQVSFSDYVPAQSQRGDE